MKMQNGYEKRNGVIIKSNNPKGYNKHKKNTEQKETKEENITLELVQQAYRDLWKAKREQLSKAQRYARLYKDFLGLSKIEQEMKE